MAAPSLAQSSGDYQCLQQWQAACVNKAWSYGLNVGMSRGAIYDIYNMSRNSLGTVNAPNNNYAPTNGKYWVKRQEGYLSWKYFPAYFKDGKWYVGARCRHGDWGMMWAYPAHGTPPPPDRDATITAEEYCGTDGNKPFPPP